MTQAHRLDCVREAADCRFIVQSENEAEAVELARIHMREVLGQDYADDERKRPYLEVV